MMKEERKIKELNPANYQKRLTDSKKQTIASKQQLDTVVADKDGAVLDQNILRAERLIGSGGG